MPNTGPAITSSTLCPVHGPASRAPTCPGSGRCPAPSPARSATTWWRLQPWCDTGRCRVTGNRTGTHRTVLAARLPVEADPRHLVAGVRVDKQRQPAPPVVVAAHRVVQAEHVRPGPKARRRVAEPGHGPAQQRRHDAGEEPAGQLGSARTVIHSQRQPIRSATANRCFPLGCIPDATSSSPSRGRTCCNHVASIEYISYLFIASPAMPSSWHDSVTKIFTENPELAVELVNGLTGARLPDQVTVRAAAPNFNDRPSTDFQAVSPSSWPGRTRPRPRRHRRGAEAHPQGQAASVGPLRRPAVDLLALPVGVLVMPDAKSAFWYARRPDHPARLYAPAHRLVPVRRSRHRNAADAAARPAANTLSVAHHGANATVSRLRRRSRLLSPGHGEVP